eukprot:COSAG03_NODE_16943_length_388_cov_0.460208_1_plen_113_part_01
MLMCGVHSSPNPTSTVYTIYQSQSTQATFSNAMGQSQNIPGGVLTGAIGPLQLSSVLQLLFRLSPADIVVATALMLPLLMLPRPTSVPTVLAEGDVVTVELKERNGVHLVGFL